ncbi:MAG: hypothetical protein JNJ53_08690 [Rhizobiales bacterium]|nr:hypothetical protein [Hyphomicrobiales bacterium]
MSSAAKAAVIANVAGDRQHRRIGDAMYRVGDAKVHVRYVSWPKARSTYAFNVNPTTLRADFEVWICGDASSYYLTPIEVIRTLYDDPDAYVDRRHPKLRVMEVSLDDHSCLYARGGQRKNFSPYYLAKL